MKYFILFAFALLFTSFQVNAQQDEQMSIYMYNPLYFNPAYAGSKDAISMTAVGRFQWIKFSGAPRSQWFSIHAPLLFKSLGIGAHLVNDKIGKRTRTSAFADISGSIKISKKREARLALGLSVGADIMGFDFTNATVNDVNDPFYGMKINTTKPNVGAGIYCYGDQFYVGISSPRLLEASIRTDMDLVKQINARHFFLAGGYVFNLNSVLKLKPSTLVKYTPHAPLTFDVNLSLLSYERLWTGLMYRYNESMGVNIGIIIKDFTFGYVYDFPINGLMNYQKGSHEIFLQLDIHTKRIPYTSPRYF
ncbi:MAG: type IX secretion system membrane protein PorP/SprF [Crocinitomicaceae bacterium]|nr:type IX secretion system membrane protein PorP/SprF [Crocinitomicaceae bacterium]